MSREVARELAELVDDIREECPDMALSDAVTIAAAAINAEMVNDAVVVLGDIADALNDMRPPPEPARTLN